MTYKQTLEFLYSQLPVYHRIGKAAYKADLSNTKTLDNHFGNPHRNFLTVHVAGTNGKGSVSHMLASILQAKGMRTGLYTSPHLTDYRERIRVNGSMIPEENVVSFVEDNMEFLMELKPSFFEMSVAMAFTHFSDEKVDIAIIETGLGGRLDSTNIIQPVLSVITNIGMDHMDLLGDTPEKIAREKAGIIKPGIPVVIGERDRDTEMVFTEVAVKAGSQICFAEDILYFQWENVETGFYRTFTVSEKSGAGFVSGKTPLSGDYQAKNILTVCAACNYLDEILGEVNKYIQTGIQDVIRNTGLSGRWQVLADKPAVICDTGHNSHGLKYVIKQLKGMKYSRIHFVLGLVSDKVPGLVLPLFPSDGIYYFAKASVPRAMDSSVLKKEAEKYGLEGKNFNSVECALQEALKSAGENDIIFIGGSTFVVADALEYWNSGR